MPQWTKRDRKKYEHIKESNQKRGTSADRAKEIAARKVNKDRREEGRTPRKRTQGTGNPRRGLEDRSREELYNRAQEMNIQGRSKMKKDELIRAIRKRS